jgi:hypothetical protein
LRARNRRRGEDPFEEWFYIFEGSFLFELAGMPFSVAVGDFVHAPSNEPHVFQNTSDKGARMLVIAKPGGLENYFAELAERTMNDPANVALLEVGARYGVVLLGPPLPHDADRKPALSASVPPTATPADGLVERRPDPVNRRVKRIYLTTAGESVLNTFEPVQRQFCEQLFEVLNDREREQFTNSHVQEP